MGHIKNKDIVALSQETIAVKGLIYALQLVMIEAVPALLEGGQGGQNEALVLLESGGESEEADKEIEKSHKTGKPILSPGHARKLDKKGKPAVKPIIAAGEGVIDESTLSWSDDEEDLED